MELVLKTDEPAEESLKLESQFVLRLPQNVADSIKKVLRKKPKKIKKYMKLDINPDTRLGTLYFNKHVVPIKLVDLPCIVESLKTVDRKIFFKTADIHQMMVWYDPGKVPQVEEKKRSKEFVWGHGITPPMKNVRKNRWRKTMKNKKPLDGPEIEKEVKWLLKMDNDAIAVRWELVEDDKKVDNGVNDSDGVLEVIDEKDVFGEMTDSLSEDEYDFEPEEDTEEIYPTNF